MQKQVTLNKAAILLKKAKELSRSLYQTKVVAYPVDAISAKIPANISAKLSETVDLSVENIKKTESAILLYKEIKQAIINANVESGLHEVLCNIDMLKNKKQYMQTLLDSSANSQMKSLRPTHVGAATIQECQLQDHVAVAKTCNNIITEITRADSKVSSVMLYVEVAGFTDEDIKARIKTITRQLSELEDQKYEINNTKKITIDIPDILAEEFGL